MSNIIRDLAKSQAKQNDAKYFEKITYVRCITVGIDDPGDPSVAGKPGYIWVKEYSMNGAVFQCFNPSVQPLVNLPVVVAKDPSSKFRRIVVGVDWSTIPLSGEAGEASTWNLPRHGKMHEWPDMYVGLDPINIFTRALVPLRVQPVSGTMSINVQPGLYFSGVNLVQFDGVYNYDLTDYIPATTDYYVHVLIYLDINGNEIGVLSGEASSEVLPEKPDVPSGTFPLAYIRLYEGMTGLSESDVTKDARVLFSVTSDSLSAVLGAIAEVEELISNHMVEG